MKMQCGINNFYQTGANEIDYFIQFFIPEAPLTLSSQEHLTPAAQTEKKDGALCKLNALFLIRLQTK